MRSLILANHSGELYDFHKDLCRAEAEMKGD